MYYWVLIIINREGVFYMIVKNCAGGLVFWEDRVFLLKDEKGEWSFPKGVIKKNELPAEASLRIANETAGITAEIVSTEGYPSIEISSNSNQNPIYSKIIWYVMISKSNKYQVKKEKGFKNGGYYDVSEAMKLLTQNNNKAMLNFLSKKLPEMVELCNNKIDNTETDNADDDIVNSTVQTYRNLSLWGCR